MISYFCRWATATSLLSLPVSLAMGSLPLTAAEISPVSSVGSAPEATISEEAKLLERLGERAREVWENFSLVTCTELLQQEKFNEKGKAVIKSDSKYDYFILLSWDAGQLVMDESRVEIDPPRKRRPQGALLATQGFATLLLVVHPEYQTSYSFTLGEKNADGLRAVHFVPRRGGRTPGALELGGRTHPITWAGRLWVREETADILRIEAHWDQPPTQLGLQSLLADVHYRPISLEGHLSYLLLPESASVELVTEHQRWRNSHEFIGYRLFSVETNIQLGEQLSSDSAPEPGAESQPREEIR